MGRQSGAWKRGVLRWRYLIIALIVILLLFSLVMHGIRRDRAAALDQRAQVSRELILAQDAYNALTVELQQVGSSSYIENVARQYYSFLKPGELRFEISNPEDLNGYTYEEMQILQQERKTK